MLTTENCFDENFLPPPCGTGELSISCRGSQRDDRTRGARFTFSATGGTHYYVVLTHAAGTYVLSNPATRGTIFRADAAGTYNWDFPVAGPDSPFGADCLPGGDWSVRIYSTRDDNGDGRPDEDAGGIVGCFEDCSFTLYPPCPDVFATAFTVASQDVSCVGDDGFIRLFDFQEDLMYCVDNRGEGANFSWTGPDGTTTGGTERRNLAPGFYRVVVSDFYDCTFIWRRNIARIPDLVFNCFGTSPTLTEAGSIRITLAGGRGPYRLSYTAEAPDGSPLPPLDDLAVEDGQVIENLPAGRYFLTLTDENGCEELCTTTLCRLDPICTPTDVVTVGGTGSVRLTLDGTPDWTVTVSGDLDRALMVGSPDYLVDNLMPGDYKFTIRDARGCVGSCTATIAPATCSLGANPIFVNPQCANEASGSIQLNPENATGELSVRWDRAELEGQLSPTELRAGGYSATITDAANCSVGPLNFRLTDPPAPAVSLTVVEEIDCAGANTGSLRATTTSVADGQVFYTWSEPGLPNRPTVGNLGAGTYRVTVTDANGCRAESSITLAEPPPLVLRCEATDETIAGTGDGTITVRNASGYTNVLLSGSLGEVRLGANRDTTFTGLSAGDYQLTLTDAAGCTQTCSAIINAGTCSVAITTTATQPDCDARTATATTVVSGGIAPYKYNWSTGENDVATVTGLTGGRYTVTVTDEAECAVRESVFVTPFEFDPTVIALPVVPTCSGECVELTLYLTEFAPYVISYRYIDGTGVSFDRQLAIEDSATETFCPEDFGLTAFTAGRFEFSLITDETGCTSDLALVAPIPVYPVAVGNLSPIICPQDTFTYRGRAFHAGNPDGSVVLPASSARGCDSTVHVSLSFYTTEDGAFSTTICATDTLDFFGTLLHATNPAATVVLSNATTNGCDSTVNVNVDFYPPAVGSFSATLCPGDTIRYRGEPFYTGRERGEVVIPGGAARGCDSTVIVNVDFFPAALGNLTATLCAGDTLYYNKTPFFAGKATGSVVLNNASQNGCDSTVAVSVAFVEPARGTLDTLICPETSFVKGGITFDGPVSNRQLTLGGASVSGCDSILDVTVGLLPRYQVTLSGEGTTCDFESSQFTAVYDGPDSVWILLNTSRRDTIYLQPGTNTFERFFPPGVRLEIAASGGLPGTCAPATSGTVTIVREDIEVDINILSGNETYAIECAGVIDGSVVARASGEQGPYRYAWSNGTTGDTLFQLTPGVYRVTATSARGCTATERVNLTAPDPLRFQIEGVPADCERRQPTLRIDDVRGGIGPYLFSTGGEFSPLAADTLDTGFGPVSLTIQDANGCEVVAGFVFDSVPKPSLTIDPRTAILSFGETQLITATTNLRDPLFRLETDPVEENTEGIFAVRPLISTTYAISVRDPEGCTVRDTVRVAVDRFVNIYAPNVFSPNRDGVNDRFRLYPHATVLTFNNFAVYGRWGEQVYRDEGPISADNRDWGWDGKTAGGEPYEQGLYVYTISITLEDGREMFVSGEVLLIR